METTLKTTQLVAVQVRHFVLNFQYSRFDNLYNGGAKERKKENTLSISLEHPPRKPPDGDSLKLKKTSELREKFSTIKSSRIRVTAWPLE